MFFSNAQISDKELWEREYTAGHVIPSTTRNEPSKALMLFAEILDYSKFRRVLDVGAGNGRNAIYLARKGCEVHCVDFSTAALRNLRDRVQSSNLSPKIRVYEHSLLQTLPFQNGVFDAIIDSYTFCHFFGESRRRYLSEIHRVAASSAYFIVSVFPPEDGYYATMPKSSTPDESYITDPSNGIRKQLYNEDELETLLSSYFKVIYSSLLRFDDVVLDKTYVRRILTLVCQRIH